METDAAQLLRGHGLSVTNQRLAVLAAVTASPHATAEQIADAVRSEIGTVSRQAVYDTLATLTGLGVLRRIQPARSPARFETRIDDNHHHLVCRVCGDTVDVDCAVSSTPCLQASDDHGFIIDEAEVIYWGVCPACSAATTSHPEQPGNRRKHPVRPSTTTAQGAKSR